MRKWPAADFVDIRLWVCPCIPATTLDSQDESLAGLAQKPYNEGTSRGQVSNRGHDQSPSDSLRLLKLNHVKFQLQFYKKASNFSLPKCQRWASA